MPPNTRGYKRSESAFHQKLNKKDREDLLKLQTLRDLPKSRFATRSCITAIPSGRGRKVVFSHIEVYKMVEQIATDLREAGVRPQTPCAFVLETGVEAVIYFLALQWIGAIALPIDPSLSAEDIATVLRKLKAVTLVSSNVEDDDEKKNDPLFQKVHTACESQAVIHWYICRSVNRGVFLDRKGIMAGVGAAWAGGAGDFKYDPNEKCVRYAIGEDGEFLVFELSHRGMAEATREFSKTYLLAAEDATILVADIHNMQGLMSVLASIYSGGNVVISQPMTSSVSTLLQLCNENSVTWISTESEIVMEMYEELERDNLLKEGLNLSFLRSYGGNIEKSLLEKMEPVFRAPVLQAYGTPETCGLVSSNQVLKNEYGTCGKAISGCDVLIFDVDQDEVVHANKNGRIGVRGPHVSLYYVAYDYANEVAYIELFEGENSGYYFLTGDEGFVDGNGVLTVTKYNDPAKRAAMLATKKEDEVKSKSFEAARAAQLAEEQRRREAEAQLLEEKKMREKEEAELLEAERINSEKILEEQQREAERKLSEERRLEELKLEESRKADEDRREKEKLLELEKQKEAERELEQRRIAVEEAERKLQERESESTRISDKSYPAESIREITKIVETEKIPDEVVDEIRERLDAIEENQKRIEEETEDRFRTLMDQMKERIEKLEADRDQQAARTPREMEEMRSALEKAAASAESSSRDTAAAAQAAKEAAAAAASAATVQEGNQTNLMEIRDPGELQKTILVSLEDVDQAMRAHAAIKSARAFGRPDPRYGAEVFCAVNPKKGARVSEPWLMLHAQSMLPAAFVPKRFFFKEDLSNTEDRAALSNDQTMKSIAEFSGFASEKIIKSPTWSMHGGSPKST
ncbi:unnamed protein product [Agarophyton chilense]|eukprot:gb/GEZJ01000440.1/.p1 GENE.gb/GEZJ01000440.1/~~gb/GEZJ01000440.1/.p1  ORF type:complete len:865 (-),score=175.61 gb/GEZJ01000440.1/:796-3390(-)